MGLQLNEIDRFNLMKQLINKPDIFQQYDPTVKVPREEIEDLIDIAIQAPSSWDEQHWKFLIFDDATVQEEYLYPISGSQSFIRDASAVVAVLGDRRTFKQSRNKSEEVNVLTLEEEHPVSEADTKQLSTQPLAAIQFMMGATAKGYDTYPTLQFDSERLSEAFNIPSQYEPVLLIALGKRKETDTYPFAQGFTTTMI